jgi:hypothetical protein
MTRGGAREGVAAFISSHPWRGAGRKAKRAANQRGEGKMDVTKYVGGLFLKVDDIKANGPVRVKVVDVSEGKYSKPDLTFDDGSKLGCNATNGRVLAKAYGFDSDDWIDKEVELVVGEITYQGKPQEAILVRPISPAIEKKAPPTKPTFDDEVPF